MTLLASVPSCVRFEAISFSITAAKDKTGSVCDTKKMLWSFLSEVKATQQLTDVLTWRRNYVENDALAKREREKRGNAIKWINYVFFDKGSFALKGSLKAAVARKCECSSVFMNAWHLIVSEKSAVTIMEHCVADAEIQTKIESSEISYQNGFRLFKCCWICLHANLDKYLK